MAFDLSALTTRRTRIIFAEIGLALLVVASAIPIWLPQWLPLQDLPQHLAAIRVISDFSHVELQFAQFFELNFLQTQYVGYYGAVWLLSSVFEVDVANRIFLTIALAATPYSMRYLLAKLGRPPGLTLFVFPLLFNTFLLLGFLNFIAAIPLMLLGMGLAARLHHEYSRGAAIGLAITGLGCFLMHVIPFAFLAVAGGLLGVRDSIAATFKRWLPLLPAGLLSVAWTLLSPAGGSTTEAMGDGGRFLPWLEALRDLPDWLTNLTPQTHDERLLVYYGLILVATIALGVGVDQRDGSGERRRYPLAQRVGVLSPLALLGYFALPISYDWIWPISPRFALLGLVLLIPAIPMPRKWPAYVLGALLTVVSLSNFHHITEQFQAYSQEEVGDLQQALDEIPRGKRVAGLIFDRGSKHVRFSPFIHSVAYYQAQRGGAVMFTFADFPQSPFRFREDSRPPRVEPRWEWTPQKVDPREELDWYDYVLVRGGPGRIAQQQQSFSLQYEGARWSVWKRR